MTDSVTPPPVATGAVSQDEKTMGMMCHLLAIFTGFLGPLIIWLMKKDTMPFVNDQGKEALNFEITIFLAFIVCGILTFIIIGVFLMPIVLITNIVFLIIATLKAKDGIAYRYPFSLRLIK